MQKPKPTIGIYVPRLLFLPYQPDERFLDELVRTIEHSGRYRPLLLDLPKLRLASPGNARKFVEEYNLVAFIQHDSELYHKNARYAANVKLIENYVPFLNSTECQELGCDKIATNALLRQKNIPILDATVAYSLQDVEHRIREGEWCVIKPHDRGAGAGVRLIKKQRGKFFGYYDGRWRNIEITENVSSDKARTLRITYTFNLKTPFRFFKKLITDFTYSPMLIEPYFNDHENGFSSLRCTVVGDEVVEAVKRTNHKNITSNVSSGGRASKIELTKSQKEAAVAATRAIGAHYAGVDFLVRGNEWIIGEVNIGPITVFSEYTGVNVGEIFGKYVINKCDELNLKIKDSP
ncbi:MAG: hypothetical protein AAB899_01575 [Patescibacteria group bacterium]